MMKYFKLLCFWFVLSAALSVVVGIIVAVVFTALTA
jgi:hypothetical protein